MKKILLSLAAVGAIVAAAAPAAAQPWDGYARDGGRYDGYHDYRGGRLTASYVDSLGWKIRNAAEEGRISWREARELRREYREVRPIAWRMQTGDASRWETVRLQRTVDHIEQAVGRGDDGWRR